MVMQADIQVTRETAEEVAALIELARLGDFNAYLAVNGYTRSSTVDNPKPLQRSICHDKLIDSNTAGLRCNRCGKFHLQSIVPEVVFDAKGKSTLHVPPVTCPHCNQYDCAGPNSHFDHEPRGSGKTEIVAIQYGFEISLFRVQGHKAECMVAGANHPEAKKRLSLIHSIMCRDGHRAVFPEVVPYAKAPGDAMRILGDSEPTVFARGIEGVPPGFHGDLIWLDDVCNQTNTLMRPGMVEKIIEKYDNVVEYSGQPWTHLFWTGTPWVEGDLDHKMERYAIDHPDEWTYLKFAGGGPEDGFKSFWPEKWSPQRLERLYHKDELAYRRAIQLQRILKEDILFRSIQHWVHIGDRNLEKAPAEARKGSVVLEDPTCSDNRLWVRIIALDVAETGPLAVSKKGRSKSGFAVVAGHKYTKHVYVLYSDEDWVDPGKHLAEVNPLAERFGTKWIAIESTGMLPEVIERFEAAGYTVEGYNPKGKEYGGSKINRKLPVAMAFNEGRAFLHGTMEFSAPEPGMTPQWHVVTFHDQEVADTAMRRFPARQSDALDAIEMACRVFWSTYGTNPEEAPVLRDAEQATTMEKFIKGCFPPKAGAKKNRAERERAALERLCPNPTAQAVAMGIVPRRAVELVGVP